MVAAKRLISVASLGASLGRVLLVLGVVLACGVCWVLAV
jgi:hypothetical protein